MSVGSKISSDRINQILSKFSGAGNSLNNTHFAPFAEIDANKFAGTLVTQSEISVTHKGGGTAAANIPRFDENCDLLLPERFGSSANNLKQNLALGALSFFTSSTERVYVDSTGWNAGTAPAGTAVKKIAILFMEEISVWIIQLDDVDVAFVDPADASVFVNGLASLDRVQSNGASIDFSANDRINFRNNGVVIGHIKVGGFFAGA